LSYLLVKFQPVDTPEEIAKTPGLFPIADAQLIIPDNVFMIVE